MNRSPTNQDIEVDINQELSAWLDGELDGERSRFLLQRLEHDSELRQRWQRWQLAASCLKGEPAQPLPSDFSERVLARLDRLEPDASAPIPLRSMHSRSMPGRQIPTRRSLRWIGGVALAASVGLAAVLLRQTVPSPQIPATAPPQAAIEPTHIALPEPQLTLKLQLPIPVRAGVVGVYRSPLHAAAVADSPRVRHFSPLPQPYALDPELEAYLAQQKSSASSGIRDAFSEHNVYLPTDNANAVGTVSWSPDE